MLDDGRGDALDRDLADAGGLDVAGDGSIGNGIFREGHFHRERAVHGRDGGGVGAGRKERAGLFLFAAGVRGLFACVGHGGGVGGVGRLCAACQCGKHHQEAQQKS